LYNGVNETKSPLSKKEFMAEQMVAFKQIHEVATKIIDEFHPERIVLFGSHSRGEATTDSDVDLLVRTSDQGQRRVAMNDYFLKDITEKGAVLYEANHAVGETFPRHISNGFLDRPGR